MGDSEVQAALEQQFQAFSVSLKGGGEQRDAAEISASVGLLRKIAPKITPEFFARVGESSVFGRQLLKVGADAPGAASEEELAVAVLFGLLLYRQGDWDSCRRVLHRQLFEPPGELAQHEHFEPLASYLFYKYLLCVERGGEFAAQADELFFLMKRLQLARAEQLYAALLVFNLRWMLRRRQFGRLAALLRQTEFPAAASSALWAKFLFYRALFGEATGQFGAALENVEQSARKTPERARESAGYRRFRLLLAKHLVALSLMLSRAPPAAALRLPELRPYVRLTALVSRGQNRDFEAYITTQAPQFEGDLVMPVLRRMHEVVLQNALKKLATAYTGISVAEALRRLGVEAGAGFDLLAFVAKSRSVVQRFSYDAARQELRFEAAPEGFGDAALQEKALERLRRVELLGEQLRRGLRYAPRVQEAGDRAELEAGLEEFDLEGLEFDDLDFDE